jgi:hypothetical protein
MLEQLTPFARFDGYWILSDLDGVPDLFARIPPILKNAVTRGRYPDPRITGMRRAAPCSPSSPPGACVTALALYWTAQGQFHGW